MKHLSDDILIEQLKQGRNEALDELYRRYSKSLYFYCKKTAYHLSPQDLEDVVQDIFVKVIKSIKSFNRSKAKFSTWVFRIAHNICVDLIRKHNRHKTYSISSGSREDDFSGNYISEDSLADESKSVEEKYTEDKLHKAITECMNGLTNLSEKQALILYYLNEKVYREIAGVMKRSISMVRNLIKTAELKVKECLEAKGIGENIR
ncbi:MAG: hypothetical protein APR54_01655 [Candidatus Cloacimonas sp. SDB]|nr:MAG: hypothetical protein APR54_01655 [Candidatus Cloacimonas sp. SDB]